MRDWKTTRFIKSIAINREQYDFIDKTKGKKSKAGRLEEIINKYTEKLKHSKESLPIVK